MESADRETRWVTCKRGKLVGKSTRGPPPLKPRLLEAPQGAEGQMGELGEGWAVGPLRRTGGGEGRHCERRGALPAIREAGRSLDGGVCIVRTWARKSAVAPSAPSTTCSWNCSRFKTTIPEFSQQCHHVQGMRMGRPPSAGAHQFHLRGPLSRPSPVANRYAPAGSAGPPSQL